jgi:hypothetical protein
VRTRAFPKIATHGLCFADRDAGDALRSKSALRAELMAERTAPVLASGAIAWHYDMPTFEQFALALALSLEVEVAA